MLLAVRISNYGCTWEVWRALKKLELLWAAPRATLTLLSCSPNFPRASKTRYTHAKHEPILKLSKVRFIRRVSAVSNAIETIDNEMICFIIYCLNCIRHGRNATYEQGLRVS